MDKQGSFELWCAGHADMHASICPQADQQLSKEDQGIQCVQDLIKGSAAQLHSSTYRLQSQVSDHRRPSAWLPMNVPSHCECWRRLVSPCLRNDIGLHTNDDTVREYDQSAQA